MALLSYHNLGKVSIETHDLSKTSIVQTDANAKQEAPAHSDTFRQWGAYKTDLT